MTWALTTPFGTGPPRVSSVRGANRCVSLVLALVFTVLTIGWPAAAGNETGVLAVASAEKLGPCEFRFAVTYLNCGQTLGIDYHAFIHFDETQTGSRLYTMPEPGPRPLAQATTSSSWGVSETVKVAFPPVVLPEKSGRDIFVKVGLYDARGTGARLCLVGADATQRVLVGRLVSDTVGWSFVRCPPAMATVTDERIGARPRALVRPMPVSPLVRFGETDVSVWSVECRNGASATLERTREELCWSEASLKLIYTGERGASAFVVRPPRALPVPPEADVARLWLLGRAQAWRRNRTSEEPMLQHFLEFRDGRGEMRVLHFPRSVGYPYWYVARQRLPSDWPRPLEWTGAGFGGCTNRKPRSLLLDALVLAREQLAPTLSTEVSFGDLPFPDQPDGLLPTQLSRAAGNRVNRTPDGCELRYEGSDGVLSYVYAPRTGGLDDVEAVWTGLGADAKPLRFRLGASGGPVIELGGRSYLPSSLQVRRRCLAFEVGDRIVRTRWRCEAATGAAEYALSLSVKGKSLLVEIEAADDALSGVLPGCIAGVTGARFVSFPYWSWCAYDYGRDGGVAVVGDVFVSGYPDWYRSRASLITFGPPTVSHRIEALTTAPVCICPGVEYTARSDGHRNPLRERFIFTVSPDVHETLPNVPHPPSPNRELLAPYVHSTGGSAARLAEQLEDWRRLAAYGVNRVYIRHFDGMWSDVSQGPQEWTLTEHAAPLVGDAALRRYLDELSRLGFLPVLYTNYTDLQPVSAAFSWDRIALLPDGDINSACWPGSYPLKPLRAVELEAQYAPRIASRFGTRGSFCDVHTAAVPWRKVDHDARLPGAAQFGTTYRCYAKLLMHERATYGAVYSEGSVHWLYAGLHDGSDAQLKAQRPHKEPFLVDFDLLKIHPKQMDAGMSWISRYVWGPEDYEELGGREAAQDRFTAATIAFGHQGAFTGFQFRGYRTDIKTFYLVQPVQMLYAMRRAEDILYRDSKTGERLGTSDAIRSGAYRDSQVYVRYDSGLEVYVNGSFTDDWPVDAGGKTRILPPSGFVCSGPGDLMVFSALTDTGRVDYRFSPQTRFVDTRGRCQPVGAFLTDGAAILRKLGGGRWGVWPLGHISVLELEGQALDLRDAVVVTAYDETGDVLGTSTAASDDGRLPLPIGDGAFRYELSSK